MVSNCITVTGAWWWRLRCIDIIQRHFEHCVATDRPDQVVEVVWWEAALGQPERYVVWARKMLAKRLYNTNYSLTCDTVLQETRLQLWFISMCNSKYLLAKHLGPTLSSTYNTYNDICGASCGCQTCRAKHLGPTLSSTYNTYMIYVAPLVAARRVGRVCCFWIVYRYCTLIHIDFGTNLLVSIPTDRLAMRAFFALWIFTWGK